jgi:hypothetical protein
VAQVSYRFIRWVITKRKAVSGGPGSLTAIQFAEFELRLGGSAVSWAGGTPSNPWGRTSGSETHVQAIDGNTATKMLDSNFTGGLNVQTGSSILQVDAGAGNTYTFDGYRYCTANDDTTRDPISWRLEGSDAGTEYDLLDTRTDETITNTRTTFTSVFTVANERPRKFILG